MKPYYEIKDKYKSWDSIQRLGLNHFPHLFLEEYDEASISNFIENSDVNTFAIRDNAKVASPINAVNLSADEVMVKCKEHRDFAIAGYKKEWQGEMVLCGEAQIKTDGDDFYLNLTASRKPVASVRRAVANATDVINGSLMDRRTKCMIRRVPGLGKTIDYMCKNDLFNVITEFTTFKAPVGIKKEDISISELRTGY
ncbi:MAG: hypothetical protein LBG88_00365 [Christensenellaceae bacterium]|nr:hypothetical protein [Christensenellaceae bacterium]